MSKHPEYYYMALAGNSQQEVMDKANELKPKGWAVFEQPTTFNTIWHLRLRMRIKKGAE